MKVFWVRYFVVFLGSLLLAEFYARLTESLGLGVLGITLFLAHALGLFIYFLSVFIISISQRSWRRFLPALIAPLVCFGLIKAQHRYGFTPYYLQFSLMRVIYLEQVSRMDGGDQAFFAWLYGQTRGIGVTQTYTVLIYDGTDQILLPPQKRSIEWVDNVKAFASREKLRIAPIVELTQFSMSSQLDFGHFRSCAGPEVRL